MNLGTACYFEDALPKEAPTIPKQYSKRSKCRTMSPITPEAKTKCKIDNRQTLCAPLVVQNIGPLFCAK